MRLAAVAVLDQRREPAVDGSRCVARDHPVHHRRDREQVRAAGLSDRIQVLEQDYRELQGRYDRIVSVEMIEAVGHQFLGEYFRVLNQRLKPEGLLLLQAITVPDQRYEYARDNVDFIKRYIFLGGFLP